MLIDKTVIATSVVGGVGSALVTAMELLAEIDASGTGIPGVATIGQLTATGAVIYLVIWLTTKTFPAMQAKSDEKDERAAALLVTAADKSVTAADKAAALVVQAHEMANAHVVKLVQDFREETRLIRLERDQERNRVFCQQSPQKLITDDRTGK